MPTLMQRSATLMHRSPALMQRSPPLMQKICCALLLPKLYIRVYASHSEIHIRTILFPLLCLFPQNLSLRVLHSCWFVAFCALVAQVRSCFAVVSWDSERHRTVAIRGVFRIKERDFVLDSASDLCSVLFRFILVRFLLAVYTSNSRSYTHKPDLTLDMFKMMKERGISPSIATYTSVIKCLSSCGRIEEADRLLDEMINNGVSASAATYNCFFKEYGGRKDWESALNLYTRMRKDGACTPGIHTYHILLGMFLKLDKMEIVKEVWEDMKASVFGPDLDSYTILVHGLIEKHKWREACEFFVEMIEKGILPQKVTFETLYRGLIQADKLRTWRRLQKRLEQESISFGSEFEHLHLQPYRR